MIRFQQEKENDQLVDIRQRRKEGYLIRANSGKLYLEHRHWRIAPEAR